MEGIFEVFSPWNTFGEYYTNTVTLFRPYSDVSFSYLVSAYFIIFAGQR